MRRMHNNANIIMQLNVPNNPMKHWSNGSRWEMANYMSKQVLKQTQIIVVGASFLSLSAYEVTTIDNQSWNSMHGWRIILILLTLEHVVEGGNANNLIVVITQTLM
jgi:hypothetical protein